MVNNRLWPWSCPQSHTPVVFALYPVPQRMETLLSLCAVLFHALSTARHFLERRGRCGDLLWELDSTGGAAAFFHGRFRRNAAVLGRREYFKSIIASVRVPHHT